MPSINNRSEIPSLLENPDFTRFLGIQSREQFQEIPSKDVGSVHEYVRNPWDEHHETAGVRLVSFTGPKRNGIYGRSVYVARLYGNSSEPFRVAGSETVPWGNDMDQDMIFEDFASLGQALDFACMIHEKGSFEINVIQENEEAGVYEKGAATSSVPEQPAYTNADLARHHQFDQAVEASVAHWSTVVPAFVREEFVGFHEIPEIMERAIKLGINEFGTQAQTAWAMNVSILGGDGGLVGAHNNDLSPWGIFEGEFFMALEIGDPNLNVYFDTEGRQLTEAESLQRGVLDPESPSLIKEVKEAGLTLTDFDLTKACLLKYPDDLACDLYWRDDQETMKAKYAIMEQAICEFQQDFPMPESVVESAPKAVSPVVASTPTKKSRQIEDTGPSM